MQSEGTGVVGGPGLAVDWDAPACVGAFMSTRLGGRSRWPWAGWNLGDHVGDEVATVSENRRAFERRLGVRPVWLRQTHGVSVVDAAAVGPEPPQADAAFATVPGVACTVQVADCLPVLLAAPNGAAVGAAHAGWRGLAGGVVEAAVEAVCRAAACRPGELHAWLGPCIGPDHFEVGVDVVDAFGAGDAFVSRAHPDGRPRWLADLPALARARLARVGVLRVHGGAWCTVSDAGQFFSYRRDGITGRMAAAVWLRPSRPAAGAQETLGSPAYS
jgi:YfiH family protein